MKRVPKLTFNYDQQNLTNQYKQAFLDILAILLQLMGLPFVSFLQQQSYLKQIEQRLLQLNEGSKDWTNRQIPQAFRNGQGIAKYALDSNKQTLQQTIKQVPDTMLNRQKIEAHLADTHDDILQATKNTEIRIKNLVKQVVSRTIRQKAIQQMGRRSIRNQIVGELSQAGMSKTLADEGWIGIVDRAGRRWNLTTYADMVTRTKLQQAHIEGVRSQAQERGVDLAIISDHNAKDQCSQFENMVISLSGATPGYLSYEQLRQSNLIFHPNCGHHVSPVRDISFLPTTLRNEHEKKMEQAKTRMESIM